MQWPLWQRSSKMSENLKLQMEEIEKQFPDAILGKVLIWGFDGTSTLSWDQLVETSKNHDISKAFLPSKLSPRRAFKRAIAEMRQSHGTRVNESGERETYSFVQIQDDEEKGIVIAFKKANLTSDVELALSNAENLGEDEYQKAVKENLKQFGYTYFSIDKEHDTVASGRSELQDDFIRLYQKHGGFYQVKDIRHILVSLIKRKCNGYKMRSGGGAWYIREPNSEELTASLSFVEDLCSAAGLRFTSYPMPLLKAEGSLEAAQDSTKGGIEDILKDCTTQIELIQERMESGTKVSGATVEKHTLVLDNLAKEMEIAADFLSFGIDDLEESRKSLLNKMKGIREEIGTSAKKDLFELESVS